MIFFMLRMPCKGDGDQLHGDAERPGGPAAERRHQGGTSRAGAASRDADRGDEHKQETAQGPRGLAAARAGAVDRKHARQRGTHPHARRDQDQGKRGRREAEAGRQDGGRGREEPGHLPAGRQARRHTVLHPGRDGQHQYHVPVRAQRLPRGT